MKFLAILRDSLREAIDSKVFYVMLALSAFLVALASTVTFSPKPGGKMMMELASIPLSVDLSNLDPTEFRGNGGGPAPNLGTLAKRLRGIYKVEEVTPLGGSDDMPDATFRVLVKQEGRIPFLGASKPDTVMSQIRERFGTYDDQQVAEVLDVRHDPSRNGYLVDARLTPAGKRMWPHDFSLFFGALPIIREGVPLGAQLFAMENILVNQIGAWIAILVSVVITAFFIPNMLRKGTVDVLIVKPINRVTLLLYKYVGGLLFILINTAVAVTGVWLALSLRSGIWAPGFLMAIPVITFFFAILYAVSTLFGVLSGSPIVSILMTCAVWFLLFISNTLNLIYETIEKDEVNSLKRSVPRLVVATVGLGAAGDASSGLTAASLLASKGPSRESSQGWKIFGRIVRGVHFILPRTGDLDALMTSALQRDLLVLPRGLASQALFSRPITWGESLSVSACFILVIYNASIHV
ncbi:MAG: ABC transporter permease [Gemmataceae bacterium]